MPGRGQQFAGVRETAANLSREPGEYTPEMFLEDFSQFYGAGQGPWVPYHILEDFARQAGAVIQRDKWLTGWRYAAGLYVAHHATLYLRAYAPSTESQAQAASTGALVGVVKSAALGDGSVTYDTGALTQATEGWGDLNATQYGQLLATRARLAGMGGAYVL